MKNAIELLLVLSIVLCGVVAGCRSVTVNEVPGGGPVYVNQSYQPDISPSLGVGDSAIKAAVDAYLGASGISAAGAAAKGVLELEAAKAAGGAK